MAALDSAHAALALGCADAARRADVLGRRARAPPRHLPSHADRARPAARARHGRAAGRDALAGRRRPAAGLGAVFGGESSPRPALALDVERPVRITRHDWRRATVDLPGYAASGPAGEHDGAHARAGPAVLRRRAGRRARRSPSWRPRHDRGGRADAQLRAARRRDRLRGRDRRRARRALPPRRRRGGHARDRPPRGRRRRSSPTTSGTSGSCASRARRSASRRCSRSRPGELDVEGEAPLAGRPARARRGDRPGRRALGADPRLLHERRLHRRARAPVRGDRPARRAAPRASENERIEIVPWPLDDLDERDRRVPRREDADRRCCWLRARRLNAPVAPPRTRARSREAKPGAR